MVITMKANHETIIGPVFGVDTVFHIVTQPVKDEIRMTISCQMPGITMEAGTLRVHRNPKNKPDKNYSRNGH